MLLFAGLYQPSSPPETAFSDENDASRENGNLASLSGQKMDSEADRMRETLRERKKLRMARNGATQTEPGSNELVLTSENQSPPARSEKEDVSCLPFLCGKKEARRFLCLFFPSFFGEKVHAVRLTRQQSSTCRMMN